MLTNEPYCKVLLFYLIADSLNDSILLKMTCISSNLLIMIRNCCL